MITLTMDEISDLQESMGGVCVKCLSEAYGVEPDARHYTCGECGSSAVFGIDELVLMGEVTITD